MSIARSADDGSAQATTARPATEGAPAQCLECYGTALDGRAFCRLCDDRVTRNLVLWARGYRAAPRKPEAMPYWLGGAY